MKVKVSQVLVAAVIILQIAPIAFCLQNPIGSPTTPPTSTQSGLVPSNRAQSLNAGNDIVTGNVGGGKAFQGIVPYGSSYYFQAPQGSGNVDSFIRNSAGNSYATDRTPGTIQPYYSPYQSVSSLASRTPNTYNSTNSSALQIPQMSPITKPLDFGLVPLAEAQRLAQGNQNPPLHLVQPLIPETTEEQTVYGNYRPLSSTPLEMEQYISQQIQGKLYPTEQQAQTQPSTLEAAPQIAQPQQNALELTVKPSEPTEPDKAFEPAQPGQLPSLTRKEVAKEIGIFEQMEKKVRDDFEKNLEQMPGAKKAAAEANQPAEANAPQGTILMPKAIVGYSTTFATQATDRFNELMKAAEQYIKQKQYYKAADAYTLAAVYQPRNPLPYAGKATALFGAGEYMSSAYFLTRAIDIFPDYTRFRVDLRTMFGDKDMLEKRVADISQWQEKTGSPELQFLLAYVYLQTDRLELAQRMINGALSQMPESRALQTLNKVIRLSIEESKKTGKP